MKKNISLLLVVAYLLVVNDALAQHWKWARNSSSTTPMWNVEGFAAATDTKDNIYAAVYNADANVSMTFGSVSVSNPGHYFNTVLVKYDSGGNALWAYGTDKDAYVFGITTDSHDNVYLLGSFKDTLTFGSTTLVATAPYHKYFLAKFSPSGSPLWAVKGGGGCPTAIYWYYAPPAGIKTDANDNVYIATSFTDAVISVGPYILHNDTTNLSEDILVAKYDSLGNVLWAKRAGGKKHDEVRALTVTPKGGVYIAGTYNSPAWTFGATTLLSTTTSMTTYIAQYDSLGNPAWGQSFNGTGYAAGLASDSASNVFLTGTLSGPSLTIGSTTIANPTPANMSCYLVKLDTANTPVWYRTGSGSGAMAEVRTYGVVADACGNAWIEGYMGRQNPYVNIGGHVIDTPAGTSFAGPYEQEPLFVAGFSPSGSYLTGGSLQSGGDDNNGFAIGHHNNLYIVSEYMAGYLIAGLDTFFSTGNIERYFLAKFSYDSIPCFCQSEPINPGWATVCVGGTVALFSPVSGGTWSTGSSVATVGGVSGIVTGLATGTAVITYMQPGDCFSVITVYVNPAPPITGPTTVYVGAAITLSNAATGGSWSSSNTAIATVGATGIVTGVTPGTVTISYTLPDGCTASLVITVKTKTGVSLLSNSQAVLYPNPVSNELSIVSEPGAYNSFIIKNAAGRMVLRQNISGEQTIVDVKNLPAGLYYIAFSGEKGNTIMKFVKQ